MSNILGAISGVVLVKWILLTQWESSIALYLFGVSVLLSVSVCVCLFVSMGTLPEIKTDDDDDDSSLNNILNVLGKQRNKMLAVHLVKTYFIPMSLYGCEVWSVRAVYMRYVDVAWNNSFRKIFNACWWEIVKPLQFYCSCLPALLLVYQLESSSG